MKTFEVNVEEKRVITLKVYAESEEDASLKAVASVQESADDTFDEDEILSPTVISIEEVSAEEEPEDEPEESDDDENEELEETDNDEDDNENEE